MNLGQRATAKQIQNVPFGNISLKSFYQKGFQSVVPNMYEQLIKQEPNFTNYDWNEIENHTAKPITLLYLFLKNAFPDIKKLILEIKDILKIKASKKNLEKRTRSGNISIIDIYNSFTPENDRVNNAANIFSVVKTLILQFNDNKIKNLEKETSFDDITIFDFKNIINNKNPENSFIINHLRNRPDLFNFVKDQVEEIMRDVKEMKPTTLQRNLLEWLVNSPPTKEARIFIAPTGAGKTAGLGACLPKLGCDDERKDLTLIVSPPNIRVFKQFISSFTDPTKPVAYALVIPTITHGYNGFKYICSHEGVGYIDKSPKGRKRNKRKISIEINSAIDFINYFSEDNPDYDNLKIINEDIRVFMIHPSLRNNNIIYNVIDDINLFVSSSINPNYKAVICIDDFFASGKESKQIAKILTCYDGPILGLTATIPCSRQEFSDPNTDWNIKRNTFGLDPVQISFSTETIGGGFTMIDENKISYFVPELEKYRENPFAKQTLSYSTCINILQEIDGENNTYNYLLDLIKNQYLNNIKIRIDAIRTHVLERLSEIDPNLKDQIFVNIRFTLEDSIEEERSRIISKSKRVYLTSTPLQTAIENEEIILGDYVENENTFEESCKDYMKDFLKYIKIHLKNNEKKEKRIEKKKQNIKEIEDDSKLGLDDLDEFRFPGIRGMPNEFDLNFLKNCSWLSDEGKVLYLQKKVIVIETGDKVNPNAVEFAINDKNNLSMIYAHQKEMGAGVHLDKLKEIFLNGDNMTKEEAWQGAGRVGRPNQDVNCYVRGSTELFNFMFDEAYENAYLPKFKEWCLSEPDDNEESDDEYTEDYLEDNSEDQDNEDDEGEEDELDIE